MTSSSISSRRLIEARYALSRAQLELRRLHVALAQRRFNPSQLRVPAGNPDGGQWTNDGSGSAAETDAESFRQHRPEIQPVGGFEKEHLGMTVQPFVSGDCQGNIRAVLPGSSSGG